MLCEVSSIGLSGFIKQLMKKRLANWQLLLVLGVLVILAGGRGPAQGQAVDDVRGVVQTYLLEQLGRPATVLEYSFEGLTWPDSALGCPQPGPAPTPGEVPGYQWFFLMDDGVRYALHSDLAGGQVVLCAPTSQYAFTYSAYQSTYFTASHPNLWSVDASGPYAFGFRRAESCALPAMRILVTAAQDNSPAALVNRYLAARGLPPAESLTAFSVGTGSTTLDSTCDGLPLRERITGAPGVAGVGYVIIQRAPGTIFNVWAGAFTEMLRQFAPTQAALTDSGGDLTALATPRPILAPTAAAATATLAPGQALPPTFTPSPTPAVPMPPPAPVIDLASVPLAHVFTGDVYIGRLNNLPGSYVTITPLEAPRGLRASADGLQLAYVTPEHVLYTVSLIVPEAPNALETTLVPGFPPAWAPDQGALAYLVGEAAPYTLRRVFPDGTREDMTDLSIPGDCSLPESAYTVERLYQRETGPNGDGRSLAWLPGGRFLFSATCGGLGLSVYDPAREAVIPLGEDLRRAQVSPDGARIAALNAADELVIIETATLEARTLPADIPPEQLGWDITSTQVFYSTSLAGQNILWDDPSTEARARDLLGVFPFESRQNTLSIRQYDIVNGVEIQVWGGNGFAVGQMTGAPDGSGLVFSLIPSDRALLTNFGNGAEPLVVRNSMPETELWWLPLGGEAGGAQLLALNSGQPRFGAPPN